MFGFGSGQDLEKEIALPFRVVLEPQEDGSFLAKVSSLPGCVARGRTKSEALKNAERAARLHLDSAAPIAFDVVFEDPSQGLVHALLPFFGRLVASTSRDGSLASVSGDFGSWTPGALSKAGRGREPRPRPGHEEDGEGEAGEAGLVDFSPQAYCLASYNGSGVAKLYAGTSASGSVYESVDGVHWELGTATGEERVHCLAEFKGRLYAGTSGAGKLFCYTGSHWSLIHRSQETALVSAAAFKGEFYVGTYPGGHVYASPDGVRWHLAFDSGQTFVRALAEHDGFLYAATSRVTGGAVYRSDNGLRWEKVFEAKDPNFYCLHVFHHALWLGTGNHGRLYRSDDGASWSLAAAIEDEGVRALASYDGRLYLAAEGKGRLYRSRFADTPPPVLSDLRVEDVTSHSAVVSWRTDRPSDSLLLYGTDALGDSVRASAFTLEHRLALSYLKAQTRYRFQAQSRGADGSEAGFAVETGFSTTGAETAALSSPTHPEGEAWSNRGEAELRWTPPDGVVRFHWCVDRVPDTLPEPGAEGVRSTPEHSASLDLSEEGVWWFHLRGQDRAGNLGSEASHYRLRLDLAAAPPRLASASHPQDGAWSNNPRVLLAWEAPPDLSGIKGYYVLLDRRRNTLPTPSTAAWVEEPRFAGDLSEDGEWWFHAVSVDEAGNVGAEASHYCFRLDRRADPPSVESPSHPDPERWFNTSQVVLRWTPPEDLSGIAGYYTLLDRYPESVPGPHSGSFTAQEGATFTGKADGQWWFHIVSVDLAGNVGVQAAHRGLRIDTLAVPPKISSPTHPAGTWVPSGRVVFEWTEPEDLSGIAGYYTLLDKEGLALPGPERGTFTAERTLEVSGLSDGLWHLRVVSKDLAGNVGTEAAHYSVRVDTAVQAPRPDSPTHPAGEEWSRLRQAELVWEAPPDLSGVSHYYWLLDRDPDTVPTPLNGERCDETRVRVDLPADGVWWFHVAAQDRAGNAGRDAGHYRLKVDTEASPPRLICPSHPDKTQWSRHTRPRFEWQEPADGSGISGYYWAFDQAEDTVPSAALGTYTTERAVAVEAPGEGVWWFHVASRDRAGNVGTEAAHWPVRLDTKAAPPLIRSSTHPDRNGWSNNPNPVFEWEAPGDFSGIAGYYTLFNRNPSALPSESNGGWSEEGRAAFKGVEDGVWWLHVVSKDRCGNVGTEAAHYPVRVDTQALPPKVASPTHPEGAWTRDRAPVFTWTPPQDASGVSGYHYLLDHEPSTVPTPARSQWTTGTQAVFQGVEDGLWYFHIVTADLAGNVGTRAAHHGICVDTSAGLARVSSATHPDPAQWYRNPNPVLSWVPPSDPSGVGGYYTAVDQNPGTVPGLQGKWTTETQAAPGPLPDGAWWFHVSTKDGAGNLSVEAAHFPLRVDTQAPKPRVVCLSHPDPAAWGGADRPAFAWEDGEDLSGVVGHHWVFDRDPAAPVLASPSNLVAGDRLVLPPQKDGVWTFGLAAKDRAGNLGEPARVSLRIETQPPSSRLEPLTALTAKPAFEVRWRGEDKVSGVASYDLQVREGGQAPWKPWLTSTVETSALFEGRDGVEFQFRVRAHDKAGNAEPWPEQGPWVGTLVDLSPPEAVTALEARPGPNGSVLLSWDAAVDRASGVAGYEVWRSPDPQRQGSCVSPPGGVEKTEFTDPCAGLDDGALLHYTVVPFDKAGNRAKGGHARAACVSDRTALAPVLSSPTHPDQGAWSNRVRAVVRWDAPADASGIAGYHWLLDQSHDSVPGPKARFIANAELELDALKDGVWWVHVATKDKAGNLSRQAGHWRLNLDTTPPPAPVPRCETHADGAWSGLGDASFAWTVPTDPAKIAGYHWCVDADPATVPAPGKGRHTEAASASVSGLDDGVWWFHVAAVDRAGNAGVQAGHCRVRVARTPPPPELSSPTHPRPGEGGSSRSAVFHWSAPDWTRPVSAWRYCLDREPATVPDASCQRTGDLRAEFEGLEPGDWCFHIVSLDGDGTPGARAAHYPFRVRSQGGLAGQVTKPNGILPLEGAQIEVFRAGKSAAKAVSGKDGRFRFEALEPGEILVKFDAPGLPALLVDGVRLDGSESVLNLSAECMAWPASTAGGGPQVRFAVLAKETAKVGVKIYGENGRALAEVEGQSTRAGHVKLAWDCSRAPEGNLLWQAVVTGADGNPVKYPIRKLKIPGSGANGEAGRGV